MFKIFPEVYNTFGHTRTSFLQFTDKRRPPGQPQENFEQTLLDRSVFVDYLGGAMRAQKCGHGGQNRVW